MKEYPRLAGRGVNDLVDSILFIIKERIKDVQDWNNLQNRFISGRLVAKIPSSSLDVDPSDRIGDINFTPTYLYVLVDNAGTAEWRRVALGSW